MLINWFPGHMTKALRMMQEEIKLADLIFYVLDARAPFSCLNPKLLALTENKPFVFILNKSDLALDQITKDWLNYFNQGDNKAISVNSSVSNSAKELIKLSQSMLGEKLEKYKQKGLNKPVRAMVVGVPNSGKSSLINNLCNKGKTVTGNRPGVTKGKQWVRVSELLEVLDTPGTLWPSFENNEVALNLAFIGSIKDNVINIYELALELIKKLQKINSQSLSMRYNIENVDESPEKILEKIGQKRGCILTGARIDLDKAAIAFLDDFRKGRLGKISLEKPKK